MSEQMVKEPGGRLISSLAELRNQIEHQVQSSPQRLKLAQAYLDSLAWGITGLTALGQKIGFQLLEPSPPMEFPKMLYRGQDYQIAATALQEQQLLSVGYSSRVSIAAPPSEPAERPKPPIISIQLPTPAEPPDGPDSDANAVGEPDGRGPLPSC